MIREMLRGGLLAALCLASTASLAKPQPGDVPPDYLGRDFQNEAVTVSQFKGRVLLVSFWATWCKPCRKELPVLNSLQKAVGRDALAVVAVNYNEDDETWSTMKRRLASLETTITRDPSERVTEAYDVRTLPHLFMIDKSGRVAAVHSGYSESSLDGFVDEINALLAQ